MIKSKIIKNDLIYIDIDKNIINRLNKMGINTIEELCKTNRKTLNKYGFNTKQINHMIIKLQLVGLDLSRK